MLPLRHSTFAILFGLVLALPSGALGVAATPDPAAPLVQDQLDAVRDAVAFASAFPAGAGLGGQLARLASVDPAAAAAPQPAPSFDSALAALYAQAGLPMPEEYVAPEPALAAALAPVLVGIAESARLTDEAFAALSPEERLFVLTHLDALFAPAPDASLDAQAERVHALSALVDMPKVTLGATRLSLALDGFEAPPMTTTWTDPNGLVEVGSTSDDSYLTPRVLIVDLGGNDDYQNRPATYHPNIGLPLPVSVILDVGGNDQYSMTGRDPTSGTSAWGQGVGIGGVGMIVDRWGDDSYIAVMDNENADCAADWYEGNAQVLYSQAVGALGVGAILDASGNDVYYAYNSNTLLSYCHFGWAYTFAQGVGMQLGVGLLVDDTGDERYHAESISYGKADNSAATYAQAVGVGGLGALLDKEGSDGYASHAFGQMTYNYVKGAFAYTFAQASVSATRRQPDTGVPTVVLPISPSQVGAPSVLCGSGSRGEQTARCDGPGVAILLDVLGDDSFVADAGAHDYGVGCGWAAIAVVSAQGSAAWTGLAALLNLDVEGRDRFTLSPTAAASGCSVLGVRAMAYGQGYGGPIYWNYWESPSTTAENVAVGLLVSAGIVEPCRAPINLGVPPVLDPRSPIPDAIGLPGIVRPEILEFEADPCTTTAKLVPAPRLTASPDDYYSRADAKQGSASCSWTWCVANAESWTQGASGSMTDPVLGMSYRANGIGILLDTGGDDTHASHAFSAGPLVESFVVGQGGTIGGIALLGNVGGDDVYDASATENGKHVAPSTRVQGWADGGTTLTVGGNCVYLVVGTFCLNPVTLTAGTSLGLFVEAFGWDTYSKAPDRFGCQQNGTTFGAWPAPGLLGPSWWGSLVSHPCPSGTYDYGTGNVVAVDWLSDVGL